jgi:hypothetical protein
MTSAAIATTFTGIDRTYARTDETNRKIETNYAKIGARAQAMMRLSRIGEISGRINATSRETDRTCARTNEI